MIKDERPVEVKPIIQDPSDFFSNLSYWMAEMVEIAENDPPPTQTLYQDHSLDFSCHLKCIFSNIFYFHK